jgi:hypothetical protein
VTPFSFSQGSWNLFGANDKENGRPLLTARGLGLIVPVLAPAEFAPVTEVIVVIKEMEENGTGSGSSGDSGAAGGTGVLVFKIPARPFIKPVADNYFNGPDAAARFHGRVATQLNGFMAAGFGGFKVK